MITHAKAFNTVAPSSKRLTRAKTTVMILLRSSKTFSPRKKSEKQHFRYFNVGLVL